jgi:radical SAM superfamily enzyme YgiQ (UPF0313 family)
MYTRQELDVAFLQPPLFKPIFPEDQDEVFNYYQRVVSGLSTPMNDLGTEPNHGLLQLAAILLNEGIQADVFDFHVLDIFMRRRRRIVTEEDFADVIRCKKAKLWGISSKIVSANRAMRIAEIIKEIHPGAIVVMGGVHPTFQAAEILQTCTAVDAVARGEADRSIIGLWQWAIGQGDLSNVPGVSFRTADGTICETEKDLEQIDLDTLPYPAYHLVARETDPLVPRILTARGCTLRCVFCASAALFGYKFNSREAERVVDQIEYVRDVFGCEFVCLGDLTFMAHRPTGMAICQQLIERKVGINWSTQTTIGRIDKEAADLMARSGCVQIGFGVETGTQLLIEHNNKNIKLGTAEKQFEIVKSTGMSVQTYWVYGLPGETFETSIRSIELMRSWIRRELMDAVHITVAVPYPGTPLYEDPQSLGVRIVDRNFDNYWTGSASLGIGYPVIESDTMTREHTQMFWRLAHAAAAEEFNQRVSSGQALHYIPHSKNDQAPLVDVLVARPRQPVGRQTLVLTKAEVAVATREAIKRSREQLRIGRSATGDAKTPGGD